MKSSIIIRTSLISIVLLVLLFAAVVPAADSGNKVAVSHSISDSVVAWIAQNAVPLATDGPLSGFDDLQPLKEMIGDARIVSMGESTHGTREMFRMKHRAFRFLVEEMGFKYFGIEASLPDCVPINTYVLTGEGEPEQVLFGQGFWTWDTEEVLDLVKWMRVYNESRPDDDKIQFFGYDMQNPRRAVDFAISYLEGLSLGTTASLSEQAGSLMADSVNNFWRVYEDYSPAQRDSFHVFVTALVDFLDDQRDTCVALTSGPQWSMARLHAGVALQNDEMLRTSKMFEPSIGRSEWYRVYGDIQKSSATLQRYLQKQSSPLLDSTREFLQQLEQSPSVFLDTYENRMTQSDHGLHHAKAASLIEFADANKDKFGDSVWTELSNAARDVSTFLTTTDEFEAMPREPEVRDRCMADNVEWMLNNFEPDAKIMLWAHNLHVAHDPDESGYGSMGNELELKYGDDHFVFGFSFNQGSFQAAYVGQTEAGEYFQKLRDYTVPPAREGAAGNMFSRVGLPMFVLDLRTIPELGPVSEWFSGERDMWLAGSGFADDDEESQYRSVNIPDYFDAVIFIDSTTAARPNRLTRERFDMD